MEAFNSNWGDELPLQGKTSSGSSTVSRWRSENLRVQGGQTTQKVNLRECCGNS